MTAGQVTTATISSQSWQNIYDFLNDNITDPRNRSKKWIYGSFPDEKSVQSIGYPLIIIEPVAFSLKNLTLNRSGFEIPIVASVMVYDNNAQRLDETTDSIVDAFATSQSTFDSYKMRHFSQSTTRYSSEFLEAGGKLHLRIIPISFMFWGSS